MIRFLRWRGRRQAAARWRDYGASGKSVQMPARMPKNKPLVSKNEGFAGDRRKRRGRRAEASRSGGGR
ncbi:hypothetical protein AQ611_00745 [Burkholderia singularis]|nr:hypothetical protein AQ611_00745 [Burkholderia sp. Bp7605]